MKELNNVKALVCKLFLFNTDVQFSTISLEHVRSEGVLPVVKELRRIHGCPKREINDAINRIQTVAANPAYRVKVCTSTHKEKRESALKRAKHVYSQAKTEAALELQREFPALRPKKLR